MEFEFDNRINKPQDSISLPDISGKEEVSWERYENDRGRVRYRADVKIQVQVGDKTIDYKISLHNFKNQAKGEEVYRKQVRKIVVAAVTHLPGAGKKIEYSQRSHQFTKISETKEKQIEMLQDEAYKDENVSEEDKGIDFALRENKVKDKLDLHKDDEKLAKWHEKFERLNLVWGRTFKKASEREDSQEDSPLDEGSKDSSGSLSGNQQKSSEENSGKKIDEKPNVSESEDDFDSFTLTLKKASSKKSELQKRKRNMSDSGVLGSKRFKGDSKDADALPVKEGEKFERGRIEREKVQPEERERQEREAIEKTVENLEPKNLDKNRSEQPLEPENPLLNSWDFAANRENTTRNINKIIFDSKGKVRYNLSEEEKIQLRELLLKVEEQDAESYRYNGYFLDSEKRLVVLDPKNNLPKNAVQIPDIKLPSPFSEDELDLLNQIEKGLENNNFLKVDIATKELRRRVEDTDKEQFINSKLKKMFSEYESSIQENKSRAVDTILQKIQKACEKPDREAFDTSFEELKRLVGDQNEEFRLALINKYFPEEIPDQPEPIRFNQEVEEAAEAKAKLEAEEAKKAEEARVAQEVEETEAKGKIVAQEAAKMANAKAKAKEEAAEAKAKLEAEEAKKAEEARIAEEAKKAEEARVAQEAEETKAKGKIAAQEAAKVANAKAKAKEEAEVKAKLEAEAKKAEAERIAQEAKKAEEARIAEEARVAQEAEETKAKGKIAAQEAAKVANAKAKGKIVAQEAAKMANAKAKAKEEAAEAKAKLEAEEAKKAEEARIAEEAIPPGDVSDEKPEIKPEQKKDGTKVNRSKGVKRTSSVKTWDELKKTFDDLVAKGKEFNQDDFNKLVKCLKAIEKLGQDKNRQIKKSALTFVQECKNNGINIDRHRVTFENGEWVFHPGKYAKESDSSQVPIRPKKAAEVKGAQKTESTQELSLLQQLTNLINEGKDWEETKKLLKELEGYADQRNSQEQNRLKRYKSGQQVFGRGSNQFVRFSKNEDWYLGEKQETKKIEPKKEQKPEVLISNKDNQQLKKNNRKSIEDIRSEITKPQKAILLKSIKAGIDNLSLNLDSIIFLGKIHACRQLQTLAVSANLGTEINTFKYAGIEAQESFARKWLEIVNQDDSFLSKNLREIILSYVKRIKRIEESTQKVLIKCQPTEKVINFLINYEKKNLDKPENIQSLVWSLLLSTNKEEFEAAKGYGSEKEGVAIHARENLISEKFKKYIESAFLMGQEKEVNQFTANLILLAQILYPQEQIEQNKKSSVCAVLHRLTSKEGINNAWNPWVTLDRNGDFKFDMEASSPGHVTPFPEFKWKSRAEKDVEEDLEEDIGGHFIQQE